MSRLAPGLTPNEVAFRLYDYCEQWIPIESRPVLHRLGGWLTGMALRAGEARLGAADPLLLDRDCSFPDADAEVLAALKELVAALDERDIRMMSLTRCRQAIAAAERRSA